VARAAALRIQQQIAAAMTASAGSKPPG